MNTSPSMFSLLNDESFVHLLISTFSRMEEKNAWFSLSFRCRDANFELDRYVEPGEGEVFVAEVQPFHPMHPDLELKSQRLSDLLELIKRLSATINPLEAAKHSSATVGGAS